MVENQKLSWALFLLLAFSCAVAGGLAIPHAHASCNNTGTQMHDPAGTYGPPFQCGTDPTWMCPNLYFHDILVHDDCATAGELPDFKCILDGYAEVREITWGCGEELGMCPIILDKTVASSHQKWKALSCN